MIRWKYVAPRLLMLVAIAVGIWLGTDPILRWSLSKSGQHLAGARVDIGRLRTDVLHGSIQIDQIRIADRDKEFKNLVQLERAFLDVEMNAALRRKFVIRGGHLEGLRFNTARDDSGRLPATEDADQGDDSSSATSTLGEMGKRGEAWLNQQVDDVENQLENDLQTVQLSRELADRWPTAYREIERRAGEIERQGKQLQERIKVVKEDPLQHLNQIQPLLASVEQLRQDVIATRQRLSELQQQMRDDQQAFKKAKQHDEQYVRERLHLDELDGRSLTEYLLGPIWSERIDVAMRWLQHSREVIPPSSAEPPVQPSSRGLSVIFPGFAASPDVLVRELQLTGDGTVDEHPFQFSGVIRDLTHQPRRHSEPTTVELEAQGAIQLLAHVILDRRSDDPIDRFVVDIPALRQHQRTLGDPARLAIALSPGTARIHADVSLHGNRLEGRLTMHQADVHLTPTLGPKYAQFMSNENAAAAVSGVDQLEAEILLSGTVRAPRYELHSNLGQQLAVGFNQAIRQELGMRQQQLLSRANQEAEQQLAALKDELLTKQGDLLKKLEIGDEQLNQLKRELVSHVGRPEDLISRGRKLLFK